MAVKRFTETLSTGIVTDNVTGKEYNCEMRIDDKLLKLLNELHEEIEVCKQAYIEIKENTINLKEDRDYYKTKCGSLEEGYLKLQKENEQLKQDNNVLIHLLENQSIIIQELHSKLLEYQVKEPIVLTKEDLELMGKAVSYYTHGRYGE